jgi:hypothetical protein
MALIDKPKRDDFIFMINIYGVRSLPVRNGTAPAIFAKVIPRFA